MTECARSHIRDTLGECTADWRQSPPDPLEAYVAFRRQLGGAASRYTTYLSTAITAGGYVRDSSLSMGEVIAGNAETALLYADYLQQQGYIQAEQSVDAVALGHVPNWRQSDYMWFWLPVMLRPEPTSGNIQSIKEAVAAFESQHDMGLFNSSQPHQLRRPLYQAQGEAFLKAVAQMDCQPVQRTIQLVDGRLSLGGGAERSVSHAAGIDVLLPAYGGSPHEFASSVSNPDLALHLARLADLGAVFVQPHPTPQHFGLMPEQ